MSAKTLFQWSLLCLTVFLSGTVPLHSAARIKVLEAISVPVVLDGTTNLALGQWASLQTNNSPVPSQAIEFIHQQSAGSAQFFRVRKLHPLSTELLVNRGLTVSGLIDLHGCQLVVDSFDSRNPLHSTQGRYDAAKRRAFAATASNRTITNTLSAGTLKVFGYVCTGNEHAVALGTNGAVGDLRWQTDGRVGVQPGHWFTNMNVTFQSVSAPFSSGLTPAPGTVNGTYYDYILEGTNYTMIDIRTSQKRILVTGAASLLTLGDIVMTGSSSITIATNASLTLYVRGKTARFEGAGVINPGGVRNFQYYGLPGNTELFVGTDISGVFYAPNAQCSFTASGGDERHFTGSLTCLSLILERDVQFHFDEALDAADLFLDFRISCSLAP